MKRKKYGQWISVANELPEYDESVLACDIYEPDEMWFAHRSNNPNVIRDSNDFCYTLPDYSITHWMRIKPINQKIK